MHRIVDFYTKLPKGPAPASKPSGLLGRYKARYFDGKNASAARKDSSPKPIEDILSIWTILLLE